MQVPDGFSPEVLGPRRCPYAGSRRVPSTSFGSMTLSLCGFPAGSLQKFRVHDVVLMRVPSRFPPEILGSWRCPYAGSQPVPSRNFGFMTLSLCGFPAGSLQKFWVHDVVLMRVPSRFPLAPDDGSSPNLRSLWSSDKKVPELAKLTKMHNCGTRASLSPCKCPYFSLPTPHGSATTPQQENVKFIQNWGET